MKNVNNFDNYLTTHFVENKDIKAVYKAYEDDYGPFLPSDKNASVLDVGCGTGIFMRYMGSKGYINVTGVDVSAEMVECCKKNNTNNAILINDLEGYLSSKRAHFDLIVMNDIIEHIPKAETIGVLKAIRSSLKKDGLLLVKTGNFSTMAGQYLRYKDFTHEIAYTESSLKQVLRMAGFNDDDIKIRGNRYGYSLRPKSIIRRILLAIWFFVLRVIHTVEMGVDRPRIYSKLLIAICVNH